MEKDQIRQKRIQFFLITRVQKLVIASLLIGFLSAILALTLKHITENYQKILFARGYENKFLLVLFPLVSLSVIYFLRKYLFNNKENKGIKEVFESIGKKSKFLPVYKIPSHFANGFLTVIFGGSTGIEVSTVVASAAIGSLAPQKESILRRYKTELIAAGVAAGIAALFGSPAAGFFFALEVIAKKPTKIFFLTTLTSILIAFGITTIINEPPLFAVAIGTWNYHAIPYFILLGSLAGIHSVYLTKCVLFFKSKFSQIKFPYQKVLIGALILTIALLLFPALYGDGYHSVSALFKPSSLVPFTLFSGLSLLAILILKPIVTSVTLASGGDGGVFAPSLFTGAFLGFLLSQILNTYFHAEVIPINFVIIGMAASLSAGIHAPFTALFLVCAIVNDYTLFLPILVICLVSKYTAKFIYPFTVYTIPAKTTT